MNDAAATLLVGLATLAGGVIYFAIAQERRITKMEDRIQGIGAQLRRIPKRKGDNADGAEGS